VKLYEFSYKMEHGEENAEITLRPLVWMGDSLDIDKQLRFITLMPD
jgi:hypothetical protein